MVCPHCHRNIPSEAVFCGACGRRVVGWKGTPENQALDPQQPRISVAPGDETKRVRPNSELIRASGGDPNATRKMSPDSDLLRVVRGEPDETNKIRPNSSLIRASVRSESEHPTAPEPATPEPATPEPATPEPVTSKPTTPEPTMPNPVQPPPRRKRPEPSSYSSDEYLVDTAYLMESALRRGRSRITLLMIADACLLLVGIYLIVSWTLLPPNRAGSDLAPTSSPGKHGYVDWQDKGQPALIATGPVKASFDADHTEIGPGRTPDAATASRRRPISDMTAMRPTTMDPTRPPPIPPVMAESAAVAKARLVARMVADQKVYLRDVPRRIRKKSKAIHDCYRQTLRLFKNVKGFVDIEFVIGADGRVTNARASRNTTRSKTLGSCISGVFLSTVFPKPPGGAVTLRYPFHFAPRKK